MRGGFLPKVEVCDVCRGVHTRRNAPAKSFNFELARPYGKMNEICEFFGIHRRLRISAEQPGFH